MLGAAAVGLPFAGTRAVAAQGSAADDWMKDVNYLNTYKEAYKAGAGQVAAVGAFYSIGN